MFCIVKSYGNVTDAHNLRTAGSGGALQLQDTPGPITTGYAIGIATYATAALCAAGITPNYVDMYPLGTCIWRSGSTWSTLYTADSRNQIYASTWTGSTTCSGTATTTFVQSKTTCAYSNVFGTN